MQSIINLWWSSELMGSQACINLDLLWYLVINLLAAIIAAFLANSFLFNIYARTQDGE